MGKTLGVLAAWSWHRIHRGDDRWPRRLVWCLPMRVLVEQTQAVAREVFERAGLLWESEESHAGKVGVHTLMGGADAGGEWELFPEEPAVLIGTQDMLLSRALNRGYASGRARWPLEFGLVTHDALWVMDEVQLMDVGLATSAQLQAFQDDDVERAVRPRLSWWMSATLQPEWLGSVDTAAHHPKWSDAPVIVPAEQRDQALGAGRKRLTLGATAPSEAAAFAGLILGRHRRARVSAPAPAAADNHFGRITLVVCNTVDRACATFDALRAEGGQEEIELVHSRFRPAERAQWRTKFLSREACSPGVNRIIVATQVVEAGVDISATDLVTELAPWPSLVQRFGRCARYGGDGAVLVVDRGRDEADAAPYTPEELTEAWNALKQLTPTSSDVGLAKLEAFEEGLTPDERKRLFPYEPKHLLVRQEYDDLFDTNPDLSGADIDISRFIRSGEERDLLVFWIDLPHSLDRKVAGPSNRRRAHRSELCAVPFLRARDWLCGEETKSNRKPRLRGRMRAWVWDWIDGAWVPADRAALRPGRIVCVDRACGGYRSDRGFDPGSDDPVDEIAPPALPEAVRAAFETDNSEDADELSAGLRWKTIACHGSEVAAVAAELCQRLAVPEPFARILRLAGLWHDLGKAHPAFQGAIRADDRPQRQDLAKAPREAWPRPPSTYRTADDTDRRPGLRHELASALALFAVVERNQPTHSALLGPWVDVLGALGREPPKTQVREPPTPVEQEVLRCTAEEFDLLIYLVACHHGKVRVALHAGPKDQDYRDRDGKGIPIRGVRERDVLPSVALEPSGEALPPLELTLEPASLGLSSRTGRSWRERTLSLLDQHGPGCLAWLEALIIAADRRASRLVTEDPVLAAKGGRVS